MGDVVNLRRERKRGARAVETAKAAENRLKFGAPKAERELRAARKKLGERALDGARLTPPDGE